MSTRLNEAALAQLFLNARTLRAWQPRDIPDALLREVIDLMKMAPTASNSLPARVVFVKSLSAKERLRPHLSAGNVEKTMTAPVTAIIGHDLKFYMPRIDDQFFQIHLIVSKCFLCLMTRAMES